MTEREKYKKERREYLVNAQTRNIKNVKPSKDGDALLSDTIEFVKKLGLTVDEVYVNWDIHWFSPFDDEVINYHLSKDMEKFDKNQKIQGKKDMDRYKGLIEKYGKLSTEDIEAILED
jgi:hypothetical protein